jgi:hypothetical protein
MRTRLCIVAVFLFVSCLIASAQEKAEESAQETLPKPDAAQSEAKAAAAAEFAKVGLTAPTISWVKVAFETGVKYTAADQIGVTNLYCPGYGYAADWFSTFVAWDSVTWNTITNGAKAQNVYYNGAWRWIVFNGSYPVYMNDGQIFNSPATTTLAATLMLRYHCLDGTYAFFDDKNAQQVTITPRIPVDKVYIEPTSVKGGQDFTVHVIQGPAAPPSNTRVYLQWKGNGIKLIGAGPCQDGIGPSLTAPCHIDVPAGQNVTAFAVHTLPNPGTAKSVTVEAVTIGPKQTATVQITH